MASRTNRRRFPTGPLAPDMLDKMHRYWRAANYLCIGQIYLFENPLLREPLKAEQIKPRLLGHWGTSPGQNLIYIHLNRLIKEHDADFIYISGPGHGGPSLNASSYLEGTYTEVHPEITQDENGMRLAVPQVLDARRRAEPLRTARPEFDARGRRTRLLAGPRLRRGIRQSRSDRCMRHRRRRVRNVPARRQLEVGQLPQSGRGRRRPTDPASQRLQDFRPDRAGADQRRGLQSALYRPRLQAVLRRGRRSARRASAAGREHSTIVMPRFERFSRKRARTASRSSPSGR